MTFKYLLTAGLLSCAASNAALAAEDYLAGPMPPGIKVVVTELDGPVFADAAGKTLYIWPQQAMRVGYSGDPKGKTTCTEEVTTKTAGMQSPWPAGLDLPELDKRPSCAAMWPAVYAPADAKPVGRWTTITRPDGTKQWAYDERPVYTSILDKKPGDTNGGSGTAQNNTASRDPVGPPPNVPPGFNVITTAAGRLVVNDKRYSVYVSDNDQPNKSNCFGACAVKWIPVVAPASAQPQGEWTIFQRAPGVRQWAFRKMPVYTSAEDFSTASLAGGDIPGWKNVYTQKAPANPSGFTVQMSMAGDLLADASGKTIYTYTCFDDSLDQLHCDTMDGPQVYRIAIGGNGSPERTRKMWPYVPAPANAKSPSSVWSVVYVDPDTGHRAAANQAGALRVWAYRDRPVYTYAGDLEPGDLEGNAIGEWQGRRNGFQAFFIRDVLSRRGG